MSIKKNAAAGLSPFAHLLAGAAAIVGGGKARAEDCKPEDDEARTARRAEEDQLREEEDARRAEEDQRREDENARRAEEDGTADSADDDDKENDAGAEDEDVDGEEPEDKEQAKAFRAGRAAERKRASAIFASPAAAVRPDLAAHFAFATKLTTAEAVGALATAAQAPKGNRAQRLDDRMGARSDARPGPGAESGAKPSFGDRVQAAVKKAGAAR